MGEPSHAQVGQRLGVVQGERLSRKILLPIFAVLFCLGLVAGVAVAAWLGAGGESQQPDQALRRDGRVPSVPAEAAKPVPPAPAVLAWVPPRRVPVRRKAAVPRRPPPSRPRIAVVIDDLGVQRAHTAATLKLPAPVNLAFFPHSRDLPRQVAQARQRGHAIMLHMPMAPRDPGVNPGPRPLTAKAKPKQNRNRLQSALAAFGNHRPIAVNNHMGSAFTAQRAQMRAVLQVLARRNLIFLDSLTAPDSRARAVGRAVGTTVLARDVFLDHRRSAKAIRAALAKTERIARRYGSAIAIGHPYPETRRALAAWLPTLKDKGIRQVRLDRLVTPQAAPERSLASTRNQAPESL